MVEQHICVARSGGEDRRQFAGEEEEVRHAMREAREFGIADELLVGREHLPLLVRAVDTDRLLLGINEPDHLDAGREVSFDLLAHLSE